MSELDNDTTETFAEVTKGREEVNDIDLDFENDADAIETTNFDEDLSEFDESAIFDDLDDGDEN